MRNFSSIMLFFLLTWGIAPFANAQEAPFRQFTGPNFQAPLFKEMGSQAQAGFMEPTPFDSTGPDSSWKYLRPPVTRKDIALEFLGGLSGAYAGYVVTAIFAYLSLPFLLSSRSLPFEVFNVLGYIWAASSILGIGYGVFMVGNNLENRSANIWITLALTLAGTAVGFALVSFLAPEPDSPSRIFGLLTLPLFASGFGVIGYNITSYFTGPPRQEYYDPSGENEYPNYNFDSGNGLLDVRGGKAKVRVPRIRGGYEPRIIKDWFFNLNLFRMRF